MTLHIEAPMCEKVSRAVRSRPQRSDLLDVSFAHNFYMERVSSPFNITINNSYSIVLIGGPATDVHCISWYARKSLLSSVQPLPVGLLRGGTIR